MDITPVLHRTAPVINAYGDGGFKIAGMDRPGSQLIIAQEAQAWSVVSSEEITLGSLTPHLFRNAGAAILLIGTGPRMVSLPPDIKAAFKHAGISVDVMDTGAACRTFNVLLAEGRQVAAALIAV